MGAELLKLTRYTGFAEGKQHLKDFRCADCGLFIDGKDIEQHNYQLWVSDYANDINKSEFLADRLGRKLTCYSLTFWLKGVDHKEGECPESESCQGCYEKFRVSELKESEGCYWCPICQPAVVEKEIKCE